MNELIAFAHGMANFAHNRGKKEEQEALIREELRGPSCEFLGAFDDSGNFAFVTSRDPRELRDGVLAALRKRYDVQASSSSRERL